MALCFLFSDRKGENAEILMALSLPFVEAFRKNIN